MLTAGLGFKVAAVPFHMWTPDVYEGAPIPITAYLAAASKAAGFALLIRLVAVALEPVALFWDWVFILLAVSSMMLGNLVAILQSNLKRLMAYSSIGQVGYLLLGIAALGAADPTRPVAGILIHSVSYAASTMVAFMFCLPCGSRRQGRRAGRGRIGAAQPVPGACADGGAVQPGRIPVLRGVRVQVLPVHGDSDGGHAVPRGRSASPYSPA